MDSNPGRSFVCVGISVACGPRPKLTPLLYKHRRPPFLAQSQDWNIIDVNRTVHLAELSTLPT